jgi:hypothetical protein
MVGTAAVCSLQRSRNEKLQGDNEVLKKTIAELKQLSRAREANTDQGILTREQTGELLELRGEVTRLREQTNQIGALVSANQKLATSLREPKPSQSNEEKHPEDALPQDIHPRDSWAFRGYASPEATVETLFWAQVNGDKAAILQAFSPEMQPELEKVFEQRNLTEEWSKTKMVGFRIVDRKELSENEIVLRLYTDRPYDDGKVRFNSFNPTVLQRIGGEWKITDKHAPKD